MCILNFTYMKGQGIYDPVEHPYQNIMSTPPPPCGVIIQWSSMITQWLYNFNEWSLIICDKSLIMSSHTVVILDFSVIMIYYNYILLSVHNFYVSLSFLSQKHVMTPQIYISILGADKWTGLCHSIWPDADHEWLHQENQQDGGGDHTSAFQSDIPHVH